MAVNTFTAIIIALMMFGPLLLFWFDERERRREREHFESLDREGRNAQQR
jgi:hypothetical protein